MDNFNDKNFMAHAEYMRIVNESTDSVSEKLSKALNKMLVDVESQKMYIVKERLYKIGIELNLDEEKERRFKSLLLETHDVIGGNEERWYYNDGSILGILIVTFYNNSDITDFINVDSDKPFKFSLSYK